MKSESLKVVLAITFFTITAIAVCCAVGWVIHREAIWMPDDQGRLLPTFPPRGPVADDLRPPEGVPIDWSKVDKENLRKRLEGTTD